MQFHLWKTMPGLENRRKMLLAFIADPRGTNSLLDAARKVELRQGGLVELVRFFLPYFGGEYLVDFSIDVYTPVFFQIKRQSGDIAVRLVYGEQNTMLHLKSPVLARIRDFAQAVVPLLGNTDWQGAIRGESITKNAICEELSEIANELARLAGAHAKVSSRPL